MAKKENVDIPASNNLKSILEILKKENYIDNYKFIADNKQGILRIYLKYILDRPAIRNIQRVSRPGLRKYAKSKKVPVVLRGKGLAIVSTSAGILTNQEAREKNLGGEIIAYIW
jgi:small subunit ribosomal protein S8